MDPPGFAIRRPGIISRPRRVVTAPAVPSTSLQSKSSSPVPSPVPSPTATGPKSEEIVETLYNHPFVRIIAFTSSRYGTSTFLPSPSTSDTPAGTLPPSSRLERTIAVGAFRIYRAPGSVAFLSCGSALQPIFPKSQCWCITEDNSRFVLQIRRPQYWRIELPVADSDDADRAVLLRDVLDKVLLFEKTECPFERGFTVSLPDPPTTPVKKKAWTAEGKNLITNRFQADLSPPAQLPKPICRGERSSSIASIASLASITSASSRDFPLPGTESTTNYRPRNNSTDYRSRNNSILEIEDPDDAGLGTHPEERDDESVTDTEDSVPPALPSDRVSTQSTGVLERFTTELPTLSEDITQNSAATSESIPPTASDEAVEDPEPRVSDSISDVRDNIPDATSPSSTKRCRPASPEVPPSTEAEPSEMVFANESEPAGIVFSHVEYKLENTTRPPRKDSDPSPDVKDVVPDATLPTATEPCCPASPKAQLSTDGAELNELDGSKESENVMVDDIPLVENETESESHLTRKASESSTSSKETLHEESEPTSTEPCPVSAEVLPLLEVQPSESDYSKENETADTSLTQVELPTESGPTSTETSPPASSEMVTSVEAQDSEPNRPEENELADVCSLPVEVQGPPDSVLTESCPPASSESVPSVQAPSSESTHSEKKETTHVCSSPVDLHEEPDSTSTESCPPASLESAPSVEAPSSESNHSEEKETTDVCSSPVDLHEELDSTSTESCPPASSEVPLSLEAQPSELNCSKENETTGVHFSQIDYMMEKETNPTTKSEVTEISLSVPDDSVADPSETGALEAPEPSKEYSSANPKDTHLESDQPSDDEGPASFEGSGHVAPVNLNRKRMSRMLAGRSFTTPARLARMTSPSKTSNNQSARNAPQSQLPRALIEGQSPSASTDSFHSVQSWHLPPAQSPPSPSSSRPESSHVGEVPPSAENAIQPELPTDPATIVLKSEDCAVPDLAVTPDVSAHTESTLPYTPAEVAQTLAKEPVAAENGSKPSRLSTFEQKVPKRRRSHASNLSISHRTLSPLPPPANLFNPPPGPTARGPLAVVSRLPSVFVNKTMEILMNPPGHLVNLMLKVAAKIAAGEWRGLVFGFGEAGEQIPVQWDYYSDGDFSDLSDTDGYAIADDIESRRDSVAHTDGPRKSGSTDPYNRNGCEVD